MANDLAEPGYTVQNGLTGSRCTAGTGIIEGLINVPFVHTVMIDWAEIKLHNISKEITY